MCAPRCLAVSLPRIPNLRISASALGPLGAPLWLGGHAHACAFLVTGLPIHPANTHTERTPPHATARHRTHTP